MLINKFSYVRIVSNRGKISHFNLESEEYQLEVCDMDFALLAAECAPWVATQTMAAIVRTESKFNPLAINVNAKVRLERQPSTKAEAIQTAKWLLANNYNIDMGLGQVNSNNMRKTNLSVEDAFDPCKNIAAAAKILQSNYVSASMLKLRIVKEL
jgi:type IV secretion system protein VirB1